MLEINKTGVIVDGNIGYNRYKLRPIVVVLFQI